MRYNDRIIFLEKQDEVYNPDTGEYKMGAVTRKTVPCFVMDLGLERSVKLFGDYEKERKVVYIRRKLAKTYYRCEYKGIVYKLIADKQSATVFYLEGDDSLGKV